MPISETTDPPLKDLSNKQESFRRNVASLAYELKDIRSRLASQQDSCNREIINREKVEFQWQKSLEDRTGECQASTSTTKQFLEEVDYIRSRLFSSQATTGASTASAQSSQFQCLDSAKNFKEKKPSLNEHENRMNRLAEQLSYLQAELQAREASEKQLKDKVLRVRNDFMQAVGMTRAKKDREILDEECLKTLDKVSELIVVKDEEVAKLRDETRVLSAQWKFKTHELDSQLAKNRRADQELKKRVLKLEFCLQEARAQTRKLQRVEVRRDKVVEEIREQVATKQQGMGDKQNFWESSNLKVVVSMSMLILLVFANQ